MRELVGALLIAGAASACSEGASEPVFNYYPRDLDLGTATWTDEANVLAWREVAVLNSSFFPIELRGLEVRGDGAPYVEARLRGGAELVGIALREASPVEVRLKPASTSGVETWSTRDLEATVRFEVGGAVKTDPSTGAPDPNSYVSVEVLVPVSFRQECDRDGDGYDHAGCSGGTDCDDTRSAVAPDETERCDGIDNDCDGDVDDDDEDGCVDRG